MKENNETGFSGFVESVGGADVFIWMVMFGALIVFVAIMAYLNRNEER